MITTRRPDGGTMVWRVWHDADQGNHGRGEAPTLVLLHGSYGSWTHWLRNIPSLAAACRVVALDIPGFGDSGCAPADRSPPDLARLVADGWRQVQVQLGPSASDGSSRLFIGGFSLGTVYAGWLARCLQSGSDTSSRVSGLVLLAPGGLGARLDKPLPLRPVGRLAAAAHEAERLAAHRHNLCVLMFGSPDKVDDLAVQIQDANVSRARFRGVFTTRPDFLLEALSGLSLPVLGVWGEKDAFDVDVGLRVAALKSVAPDATVAVVKGAGHWVGYEAHEQVNALILNWMQRW